MCSNVFYLAELGVCKLFRNQKLGNKLTSRLIDKLIQEGTNTIVLRTDLKAQAARRLYQKLGFVDLKVLDSKHANRTYWIIT
jgi:ribosomal protein S18 acetylase RimI-like enzyme